MSVASKNPFDLLGNDQDGDSDTPSAPVKTVEKTSTHTTKRNASGEAPASSAPASHGSRRGGYAGNEAAFRDRNAGSDRNRSKPTDDSFRGGARGRGRGGRGGRFPRERDDRHAKNNIATTTEKAVGQSWGATEGQAELKDEEAGEAIAQSEQKEAAVEDAQESKGPVAEPEPEDNSISFAEYQAQQAAKKAALEAEFANLSVRKPNEGVKENKKWATAKPLVKEDDDEFIAGSGGKTKREREKKVKQIVEIDQRYVEPRDTRGGRGGRGGSRGDGPRGGSFRGDGPRGRGDGPRGRGDGPRGRGDGARGRGRGGPRGDFRGGRSENQPLNTNDEAAFPSLGK